MYYHSTRDPSLRVTAAQAIVQGLAPDGGLFVPAEIPEVELASLQGLDYCRLAARILGLYLTGYSEDFLLSAAKAAYGGDRFGGRTARLVRLEKGLYSLELWHGPTSAFKDYALQLMPRLLAQGKLLNGDSEKTAILVATSGDTGKAALEGYRDLPGIEIAVFYPDHGTSEIQRLQMATQQGANVHVYAVQGNFDDAQTGVKKAFADPALAAGCRAQGKRLSSANSINWGRLVPQIVYYFAAYLQLVQQGGLALGQPVVFSVPTGNFGDILAGYYARRMGLPVRRLICASNQNRVLTDFGLTGQYNADRPFYKTASPSMDILISSNLERLLYHESGDAGLVKGLMARLAADKQYTVPAALKARIGALFRFGCADEAASFAALRSCWQKYGYLADPHTAVGLAVASQQQADDAPCIVLSTASPYKFPGAVLTALGRQPGPDDFANLAALQQLTGQAAPQALAGLSEKPVRFTQKIAPSQIADVALSL